MRIVRTILAAGAALLLASGAQAEAKFFGGRVGAADVPKVAQFYESVFGLQETSRLELPGLFEIILNFGASAEAAKKNKNPQIIVMRRESDDIKDTVPHLIMKVTDIDATVAAVKAAGGSMDGELKPFKQSRLGFAVDPAGNRIEIIQLGKGR